MDKEQKNILIVDDTPENLRLLATMLGSAGYKIRPVPNGKLALRGAHGYPPDLILLDINMPDMNGYEVCRHLKTDARTKDIPVIFISALSETIDKVKAFEIGGVDYITKPFHLEEVLARVQTHITIRNLQIKLEKANHTLKNQVQELHQLNAELQEALAQVRVLKGLLPICASCKKIRDDEGFWHQVEAYIAERSEATFTHGICPDCKIKLYPELYQKP